MNCRQALRLLYDVLDREASPVDSAEVEKHLKNCRHCMERYQFEKMFQALVVEKGQSQENTEYLKERIRTQLDEIDAAGEVSPSPSPFKWAAVTLAVAAALSVCVLAAFKLADYYHYRTEIVPFIDAYYAHTGQNYLDSFGVDPLDYLYQQTSLRLSADRWPAENIRSVAVDTINGVEFACLEMIDQRRPETIISVFVTRSENYRLPNRPLEEISGRKLLVHRCQRCSLIGETKGDYIFVFISKPCCRPDELAQLAAAL